MSDSPNTIFNFDTCSTASKINHPFIYILKRGEDFMNSLLHCAKNLHIKGASVTGLGAIENPTLAYYHLGQKKYQNKHFTGLYEVVSLTGNIGLSEGVSVAHVHIVLSDSQFHVIGGHFVNGIVGGTMELNVQPLQTAVKRTFCDEIGLKLIEVS